MKYKFLWMITLMSLFTASGVSQDFEKIRNLQRTFPLKSGTEIRIINKYGNIHIVNWDKDSVRFEIELQVKANKSHKVDKMFENIDFDFTSSNFYIIAQTVFKNESSAFWQDISDFASILFKGGTQARIDYRVFLPSSHNVDIQNKFGNVYTGNHEGDFKLNLSNGDFRANHIKNASMLKLSFGKFTINRLDNARIDLGYGDLDIKTSGTLNILSNSSTLILGESKQLDLDSRRDKIYINKLNKLNGKSSFSYINIKELAEQAIMNTNYGDMSIDNLQSSFHLLNLISEYTEVKLGIAQNAALDLEINYNHKTYMLLPQRMEPFGREKAGSDEDFLIRGHLGGQRVGTAMMKISIQAGSLQIFEY